MVAGLAFGGAAVEAQGIAGPLPASGAAAPAPPAVAAAQQISLADALRLADTQNPQVLEASGQADSARASVPGQSAPLNGTLSFAGLNNTVAVPNFGNGANYAVVLPVETSGRFLLRGSQSRALYQAAKEDVRTARLNVKEGVVTAYVALQVANEVLGSERMAYGSAQKLDELTADQFRIGSGPQSNALRAHIAFVQEGQNLTQTIATVLTARANLNMALGRPAATPVDTADSLVEPVDEPAVGAAGAPAAPSTGAPIAGVPSRTLGAAGTAANPQLAALEAAAGQNRPEIKSAEATERAQAAATHIAERALAPDLFLARDFTAHDPVEIGLAVPLPDFGQIGSAIRAARASEKAQRAAAEQARDQALLDVQTAYIAVQQTLDAVDSYRTGILPQSTTLLNQIRQGYALGANTILDLIDAQNTFRSTHDAYYAAVGGYRQAVAQLERAIGGPIPAGVLPSDRPIASAGDEASAAAGNAGPNPAQP